MFILESIDWTFSTPFALGRSGVGLFDCRKHHWYPATFIPEIPYTLIEVLTKQEASVYDPFAGIGTTVFQALILGRTPYGNEFGSVAVMFMRSLWRLFQGYNKLKNIPRLVDEAIGEYNPEKDYASALSDSRIRIEELRKWFSPHTFNQVVYLILVEKSTHNRTIKAAFRIALSAALKAVCAQQRGWGCIADNVRPKAEQTDRVRDALARFRRNATLLARDVANLAEKLPDSTKSFLKSSKADSHIFNADARGPSPLSDGSIDLVVTSPPYPNMTDYATSQRLSHYWLGSDPQDEIAAEIGARRKRSSASAVEDYIEDMHKSLREVARVIRPRGYACFVMPRFEGKLHGNGERRQAIQRCLGLLPNLGFLQEGEFHRFLPARRRHHNQNWTSLEQEDIVVFRRMR